MSLTLCTTHILILHSQASLRSGTQLLRENSSSLRETTGCVRACRNVVFLIESAIEGRATSPSNSWPHFFLRFSCVKIPKKEELIFCIIKCFAPFLFIIKFDQV